MSQFLLPIDLDGLPDGVYGDIEAFLSCFEPPYPLSDSLTRIVSHPPE